MPAGVIDTYRFETSTDGKTWTIDVNQARFGNIRNNPVLQEVTFKQVAARYLPIHGTARRKWKQRGERCRDHRSSAPEGMIAACPMTFIADGSIEPNDELFSEL